MSVSLPLSHNIASPSTTPHSLSPSRLPSHEKGHVRQASQPASNPITCTVLATLRRAWSARREYVYPSTQTLRRQLPPPLLSSKKQQRTSRKVSGYFDNVGLTRRRIASSSPAPQACLTPCPQAAHSAPPAALAAVPHSRDRQHQRLKKTVSVVMMAWRSAVW